MHSKNEITLYRFKEVLTPENLRQLHLIILGMMAFAIFFFLVTIVLYISTEPAIDTQENQELIYMLTIFHFIMLSADIAASIYFFKRQLQNSSGETKTKNSTHASQPLTNDPVLLLIGRLKVGYMLRYTTILAGVFFGFSVCIIGILNGTLYHYPLYWINLFSFVFFIIYFAITFPSIDRLETIFNKLNIPP